MYEHLRNELAMKLGTIFGPADIDIICRTLDSVANGYDIKEKQTALVVYEGDNFPRLAEIYLQAKKLEGVSKATERLYRGRLRIFFEEVQKRPEDITTNDIRCYLIEYQRRTGITDRSLDKDRQIINGFFSWCVDEEYLIKNPCKNIKEIKYTAKPRKALTRMELEVLRRACANKRELAIVDTLYSTGCRVSELVRMKMSEIDREEKSIRIFGKGGKYNTCYFNTNAQISINEYLDTRTDTSDFLFTSDRYPDRNVSPEYVQKLMRRLGKETGLVVSPHILRHTFATLALQSGMPLTHVQKSLGHASSDTTLIYAEILQADVKTSHLKYVI